MSPEWSPSVADSRARLAGIDELGDQRWKVIACAREEFARSGRTPGLRRIERLTGIPVAELHELFPGGTAALIARLAGVRAPGVRRRAKPAC